MYNIKRVMWNEATAHNRRGIRLATQPKLVTLLVRARKLRIFRQSSSR